MMLVILKVVLLLCLFIIAFQDFKERNVYLWLLLIAIGLTGFLYFQQSIPQLYLIHILFNFAIIAFIIGVLYLYARFKLQLPLQKTFGFGDVLFFLVLAVGFPTISFIVLFSFSLLFSLLIFVILKKNLKHKTVPLAGFQALFLSLIFLTNWIFNFVNLYHY